VLNFISDLSRFGLGVEPLLDSPDFHLHAFAAAIKALPRQTLGPLIKVASALLAAAADGTDLAFSLPAKAYLNFNAARRKQAALPGQSAREAWNMTGGSGGLSSVFLMRLPIGRFSGKRLAPILVFNAGHLLDSEEGLFVRRCPSPCRRIFLATRNKQRFCGRRCAMAATFKRYKQAHGEEYKTKHREAVKRSFAGVKKSPQHAQKEQ